jgi:hypothetical protein
VSRSDTTPIMASRPFTSSVSGFQKPWTYPSSLGFAAVPRKARAATATESPTLSWNCVLIELPVMISSITAAVNPIMAARPLTRSATERKSLERSTFLRGGTREEVVLGLDLILEGVLTATIGLSAAMQDIVLLDGGKSLID